MNDIYLVVRVEGVSAFGGGWDQDSPIAAYPEHEAAEQHCKLANDALDKYKTAKRGTRTEYFKRLRVFDPGMLQGQDYGVEYWVRMIPFRLHVDQFMEMNGQ
jgi:hypothetical protein